MESDRFDIDAVAGENVPPEQVYLMLRSLLDDRFALNLHRSTKETDVYILTVARNGSKLQPVQDEGTPHGVMMDLRRVYSNRTTTVPAFASVLENVVGRIVVDKTGLSGYYIIDLRWGRSESGDEGASFFTAIEEQLGLRLGAAKTARRGSCDRRR